MELKLEQVVIRDDDLVVFFPLNPCIEGELVVTPIHAFKNLEEMPEFLLEKMFHVVDKMSATIFDVLGCHGTNLLIQNEEGAGQSSDSLFIRIIPRFDKDSVDLKWEGKPASSEDLDKVISSFDFFDEENKKAEFLNKQKKEVESLQGLNKNEVSNNISSSKADVSEDGENVNYLLRSLRRNP